jgi:hypothetical protein
MRIVTKEELVFVGGGNAGDTVSGTFAGTTSPSDATSAGSSSSLSDIATTVADAVLGCLDAAGNAKVLTKNPVVLAVACVAGAVSGASGKPAAQRLAN